MVSGSFRKLHNHLVASAVEGLAPESVSVLDMNGNLLGRPRATGGLDGGDPPEAALDYRRRLESDLVAKIHSTLEPLLGAGQFRAGASVDCDFSGGEQSEEIFDPARSVMLTSQRSEDEAGSTGSAGVPGTASSLPRPAARTSGSGGRSSRVTESITYQTSRTVKKTHLPAGAVRKVSIAVLVDQGVSWVKDGNGYKRVLLPPPPETLKVIRDLVAGVTGFNAERGDQLIVESLPFETTLLTEPPAPSPAPGAGQKGGRIPFELDRKMMIIAGGALAALLVLASVLLVLVRRRKRKKPVQVSAPPAALPAAEIPVAEPPAAVESGSIEDQLQAKLAEHDAMQKRLDSQALATLKLAPPVTKTAEVFAKHLRDKIQQDPEVAAHILRSWIRSGDDE
jgi:flagellar M-ring protein FliF